MKNQYKKYLIMIIISVIISLPIGYYSYKSLFCELTPSIVSYKMGYSTEDEYWESYSNILELKDGICDFRNGDNSFNDVDCHYDLIGVEFFCSDKLNIE